MARTTRDLSRPQTRSMTSGKATRRSERLRSTRGWPSTPPSSPSFLRKTTRSNESHPPEKRSKPVAPEEFRSARSRRRCSKIQVQTNPRSPRTRSREIIADPSLRDANTPACNSTSSRLEELEEQLRLALQAKQEFALQIREHRTTAVQSTLKHLEEHFTCPLCFEILACSYSLTPQNCGHTFCACCILKWFFSRLHNGCGGWHEAVDCPLCRTALPHTPDRVPRSISSFPFTPNRTADSAVQGLINSIARELGAASTIVPGTSSEWDEDGHSKQEWSKRQRAGRTEMTSIAMQWTTLKPTDFITIKNRLEV